MKKGVNARTIIHIKKRKIPKGKNCRKCKNWVSGFCKAFNITIIDKASAKVCRKYSVKRKYKYLDRKNKNTKKISKIKYPKEAIDDIISVKKVLPNPVQKETNF